MKCRIDPVYRVHFSPCSPSSTVPANIYGIDEATQTFHSRRLLCYNDKNILGRKEILMDSFHKPQDSSYTEPDEIDLTNIRVLRNLLADHNMQSNKYFGQNFLIDRSVLQKIVNVAEIRPDDEILEVGAGTGVLTRELA